MRGTVVLMAGAALAVGLGGCARERQPRVEQPHATKQNPKVTPPPAGTPLAKVREGMTEREVQDILGPPDDSKAYITGKAFIPYYFGPDQSRFAAYYKGKGRVIFSGGNQWGAGRGRVVQIEYDPNETGYAR